MKLVKQYSELWGQTPTDPTEIYKWIERAGRTCYKSDALITNESSVPFCKRMIKSGHTSVTEQSNVVFRLDAGFYPSSYIYEHFGERMAFHQIETMENCIYVNGNLNAWIQTFDRVPLDPMFDELISVFAKWFGEVYTTDKELKNATPWVDCVDDPDEVPTRLRKYTVKHVTDRAMTHQVVRYRIDSAYCLHGDTKIYKMKKPCGQPNQPITIKELYEHTQSAQGRAALKNITLRGVGVDNTIIPVKIKNVVYSGIKKMYKLTTKNGRSIKSTAKHRYMTPYGWKRLSELSVGDSVICNGLPALANREFLEKHYLHDNMQRKELAALIGCADSTLGKALARYNLQKPKRQYPNRQGGGGYVGMHTAKTRMSISKRMTGAGNHRYTGDTVGTSGGHIRCQKKYDISKMVCDCGADVEHRHHCDKNPVNNTPTNIEFYCEKCHNARHSNNTDTVFSDEIISITPIVEGGTYDIEIDHECHNFIAEGICVHNSQESQRYCGYNDVNKFDGQVTFVVPVWAKDLLKGYNNLDDTILEDIKSVVWLGGMQNCENLYLKLLEEKAKPEQARTILPNSTKTEIIVTRGHDAWLWFFKQRTKKDADPQMQDLAFSVLREFKNNSIMGF